LKKKKKNMSSQNVSVLTKDQTKDREECKRLREIALAYWNGPDATLNIFPTDIENNVYYMVIADAIQVDVGANKFSIDGPFRNEAWHFSRDEFFLLQRDAGLISFSGTWGSLYNAATRLAKYMTRRLNKGLERLADEVPIEVEVMTRELQRKKKRRKRKK
jgi:hypothetical protein